MGTSTCRDIHTQVLRLLIPIVQQSKLLLSCIQVTIIYHNVIPGKLDFPGQNYYFGDLLSVYVHMHMYMC